MLIYCFFSNVQVFLKIISLYLMRKSEDANRTEAPSEEIVGCGTLGHKC